MIRNRRLLALIAMLLGLALVAAACGGDDDAGADGGTDSGDQPTAKRCPTGGDLVIGAEQEPDCADWIASCGGSSWGFWTMGQHHDAARLRRRVRGRQVGLHAEHPARRRARARDRARSRWSPTRSARTRSGPTVSRSPPPTSSTRGSRSRTAGHLRHDRLRQDRVVDDSDPKVAVVTFETPFAAGRSCSAAATASSRRTSSRARTATPMMATATILRWPVDDRGVGQGRRVDARAERRTTGARSRSSTRSSSGSSPTPRPSSRRSRPARSTRSTRSRSSTWSSRSTAARGRRAVFTADTGNLEALWMNNAKAPFDSWRFARRSPTPSTVTRSSKRLFGGLGVDTSRRRP